MDLLVRLWNILSIQIKLHYWDSNFIGQSTATDVFNNFLGGTKNIDESKMIEVSMDGPSTNRKFSELLIAYKADQNLSNLKNIGSCSIHILLGAFKFNTYPSWGVQIQYISFLRRSNQEQKTSTER